MNEDHEETEISSEVEGHSLHYMKQKLEPIKTNFRSRKHSSTASGGDGSSPNDANDDTSPFSNLSRLTYAKEHRRYNRTTSPYNSQQIWTKRTDSSGPIDAHEVEVYVGTNELEF